MSNVISTNASLYCRYVDDIFVIVNSEANLILLRDILQQKSVLKFSYEIGFNKLPFLDVNIEIISGKFITSVHTKDTSSGDCLNYKSECPDKYKVGVIYALILRAYKVSSDWQLFDAEIQRLKPLLANNGYPTALVESTIKRYLDKKITNIPNQEMNDPIKIYYANQMNSQYKKDEKVLGDIIKRHVKTVDNDDRIQLNVYYTNKRTSSLFMKNNVAERKGLLRRSSVVYKIECPFEDCELQNCFYLGQTRNTISKRLTYHLQDGALKEHVSKHHHATLTRQNLEDHISVVAALQDYHRLSIYEALMILKLRPSINRQQDNFHNPLKLFARASRSNNRLHVQV